MSIPLHLASIKSSGVYRFIWDKSEVPPQVAETLRLVVGYSERGPFNTPVYVSSKSEFATTFGKPSKRLERKGVYFHRIADQCLNNGPILAFNLKPFENETVNVLSGNHIIATGSSQAAGEGTLKVTEVYDTTKFWSLDPDHLAEIATAPTALVPAVGTPATPSDSYTILSATDAHENAVTIFARKTPYAYVTNYDLTIRSWFSDESADEIPSYLEGSNIIDTKLCDYFQDIFVFKGKFDNAVKTGALSKYFVLKPGTGTPAIDYPTKAEAKTALNAMVDKMDELIDTGKSGEALMDEYGTEAGDDIKKLTAEKLGADPTDENYNTLIGDMQDDLDVLASLFADSSTAAANIKTAAKAVYDALIAIAEPANLMADEDNLYEIGTAETPGIGSDDVPEVPAEYVLDEDYENVFGEKADVLLALARDPNSRFIGSYRGIILPYFKNSNGSYISIDVQLNADYDSHKLMMKLNEPLLDQSVNVLLNYAQLADNHNSAVTDLPVYNQGIVERYMDGYVYSAINADSDHNDIMDACMEIIDYKGIHEALTNRVDVEYHYIIDTFAATASPDNDSKYHQRFATLAMDKENAFAMINYPAIRNFKDVTGVVNHNNHTIDMNKVVNAYELPAESDGASFCAYFTPILFSDGTLKNIVPSVGLISNNFMAKYGARQPYYIVAGPTYGRLTANGLVGPEYGFARSELDILEPAGINAIIYTPRLGTYVNSNQTAKQTPVSALSKIHVRELVIYLTDEIANLLQNYQWELNTQELRDTIKAKADSILETVQHNGGVYDFLNICDSTNNTPEIIDNEMLVLDTHIEPARGAGKMIHQLTIHKTGAISSTIR